MQTNTLYVGNLKDPTDYEQLSKLFSPYGKVVEIKINTNRDFGFVSMSSNSQAKNAKKALDCSNFKGNFIRVIFSHTG
jgi:RNA recognition motif-containing protein